jgi:hypothetical protein
LEHADYAGRTPYPDSIFADARSDFARRAGAHVVRGILDLAGLKFDAEGAFAAARQTG